MEPKDLAPADAGPIGLAFFAGVLLGVVLYLLVRRVARRLTVRQQVWISGLGTTLWMFASVAYIAHTPPGGALAGSAFVWGLGGAFFLAIGYVAKTFPQG